MIKKILLVVFVLSLAACQSSKPVVRTSKTTTPTRTVKKPVATAPKKTDPKTQQTEVLEATSQVKVTQEIVLKYIDVGYRLGR